MNPTKIDPIPQPYSRHLRAIARILAERESDGAAVAAITRYLEHCGISVAAPENPCYHEEKS